jgi:hypothetical protein
MGHAEPSLGPGRLRCRCLRPPVLRLAIAVYLARVKGQSRVHTESDLRSYINGCNSHGLDPLAASRPHVELYFRWLQEVRRYRPSTVSRRTSVVAGFYRTCVIDGALEHSPAEYVLQFEALLTVAKHSPNLTISRWSPPQLHPRRLHGLGHLAELPVLPMCVKPASRRSAGSDREPGPSASEVRGEGTEEVVLGSFAQMGTAPGQVHRHGSLAALERHVITRDRLVEHPDVEFLDPHRVPPRRPFQVGGDFTDGQFQAYPKPRGFFMSSQPRVRASQEPGSWDMREAFSRNAQICHGAARGLLPHAPLADEPDRRGNPPGGENEQEASDNSKKDPVSDIRLVERPVERHRSERNEESDSEGDLRQGRLRRILLHTLRLPSRLRICRCRRAHVIGVFASDTTVPTTKAAATAGMNQPGRTRARRPDCDQREQDAEHDAANVAEVGQRPRLFADGRAVVDREAVGQRWRRRCRCPERPP